MKTPEEVINKQLSEWLSDDGVRADDGKAICHALSIEGFTIAPREPTEAMHEAGHGLLPAGTHGPTPNVSAIYRAMLAAKP